MSLLEQDYTRKLKRQLYYFQRKQRFMQLIRGQTARHHVMQLARDREARQVQVRCLVLRHVPGRSMLGWCSALSCSSFGIGRRSKLRCKLHCSAGIQQLTSRHAAEVRRQQGRQALQEQVSCCCSAGAPRRLPGSMHMSLRGTMSSSLCWTGQPPHRPQCSAGGFRHWPCECRCTV